MLYNNESIDFANQNCWYDCNFPVIKQGNIFGNTIFYVCCFVWRFNIFQKKHKNKVTQKEINTVKKSRAEIFIA